MVVATVHTDDAAKELASRLHGRQFGVTIIEDAAFDVALDAEDEPAVYLSLRLSDPEGETWPYEDVLSLRKAVLSEARDIGVPMSIHVRVYPATDLPQSDDEPPEEPKLFDDDA